MHACRDAGAEIDTHALERGLRFYTENFIADDGAPRYYPDRRRPVDATACAQTILTLCTFGELERARMVADWTLRRMSNRDGSFAYRLGRLRMDRTPFARWSVAWMFCALSRLSTALAS
jgi:hypothetical protein